MPIDSSSTSLLTSVINSHGQAQPIWSTRSIDWPPLNSKIPMSVFVKFYKAARHATITTAKQRATNTSSTTVGSGTANNINAARSSALLQGSGATSTSLENDSDRSDVDNNNNNYFTGLMNRVLNPTNNPTSSSSSGGTSNTNGGEDSIDLMIQAMEQKTNMSHPNQQPSSSSSFVSIRSPRPKCVAAANGWIVAVVDIPVQLPNTSSSNSSGSNNNTSTVPPPPLRLLNRWNVRRGTSSSTNAATNFNTATSHNNNATSNSTTSSHHHAMMDQWMVVPAPLPQLRLSSSPTPVQRHYQRNQVDSFYGRIVHVFVDPTGSHTLLSSSNGELYYAHYSSMIHPSVLTSSSSQSQQAQQANLPKVATKLKGFGLDPQQIPSYCNISGVSASSTAFRSKSMNSTNTSTVQQIQLGLTPHSYITAVAWDKERGTEGSTKIILFGTNIGEIYEYGLTINHTTSSGAGANTTNPNYNSSNTNTNNNSTNFAYDDTASTIPKQPVLLHALVPNDPNGNADGSEIGAAVTGLYFERLRTGLMVMVSTSGRQKRTRLYSFYSPHSSSFRMVMADQQHMNLQELPGSMDYADLQYCHDHFAMRTQTGIYYGTMDRSMSGPSMMSGSRSSMIIDSGIVPYTSAYQNDTTSSSSSIPVALAVTPHHIVTLTEQSEIHFLNRVSQTIIQSISPSSHP
jgi:hypothetical protein